MGTAQTGLLIFQGFNIRNFRVAEPSTLAGGVSNPVTTYQSLAISLQ